MAKVDPDEVAAGIAAAKVVASKFTYMGVSVGSKVTEEEYNELVTAIIEAVDRYRAGTSI
jgi:hypothetical protein